MLVRVTVFHRIRDRLKWCIATRVRRLKAMKEQREHAGSPAASPAPAPAAAPAPAPAAA